MTQDKHTGLTLQGAIDQVLAEAPAHEPVDPTPDAEATEGEAYHRDLARWQAAQMLKAGLAGAPDKAGDREGVDREAIHDAIAGAVYVETPDVFEVKGIEAATDAVLAALSAGNEEPRREGVNPAVPKMAQRHAVDLEQCALFVESAPLKRAMADAASFLRELASPTPPVSPEPDSRAGVERETIIERLNRLAKDPWPGSTMQWVEESIFAMTSASRHLAAPQSPPTASAAAGPVDTKWTATGWGRGGVGWTEMEWFRASDGAREMYPIGFDPNTGQQNGTMIGKAPTPDPHPVPAMEGR